MGKNESFKNIFTGNKDRYPNNVLERFLEGFSRVRQYRKFYF